MAVIGFMLIARACGAGALVSWQLSFAALCVLLVLIMLLVQGISVLRKRARN